MIKLETERLCLRDHVESDFEAYYKLKTDEETMYYMQDIKLDDRESAKAEFEDVLADIDSDHRQFYFLHMELKDTHEQVGSIGYNVVDDTPVGKIVHLGYFTYPKFWGNGYTSEALKKVLEYAFTKDNVYRVTTGCLKENTRSERVMQKNGMIKEAEHVDYEWHDGQMKTRLEYRLLKKEWEEHKGGSMSMTFKHFTDDDYEAVCDFLIELNAHDTSHINWNWARFEWMYEHPEFNKDLLEAIGLWIDQGKVVGAAIYDMYFGEGFCGVLPEYKHLYPEILDYACANLKDDSGFAIALCDDNTDEMDMALNKDFTKIEQTENIMELDLDREFNAALPEGYSFANPDPIEDLYELSWLFWQGFDHGEDKTEFEKEELATPRQRKHFNRDLSMAARNSEGELASLCGLWYSPKTDYVYVEPVCTIPSERGKGVAKAVIHEALNRAKKLGAKRAFVISDMDFYARLGFRNTYHYTFYKKQET